MSNTYLTEAFKELDLLNEEVFDPNDDITSFKELVMSDDDTIDVIDPEAKSDIELEDSYIGKVVLDCCVCHSKIYKDADSVVISDDAEIANEDEECPYCYSTSGFKIIGQITPYEEDAELKVEVEDKVEDEADTEEVEDELEEGCHDKKEKKKNESLKQKFTNRLTEAIKKRGNKKPLKESYADVFLDLTDRARLCMKDGCDKEEAVSRAIDDGLIYTSDIIDVAQHYGVIDDSELLNNCYDDLYSDLYNELDSSVEESLKEETVGQDVSEFQKWVDYDMKKYHKISDDTMNKIKKAGLSVTKDQYGDYEVIANRKDESLGKDLKESIYSLVPKYDGRASFYNKAKVSVDGNSETLISYDTPIIKLTDGKIEVLCDESALSGTTMRHVREFLAQMQDDGKIDLKGQKITRSWVASKINDSVGECVNEALSNISGLQNAQDIATSFKNYKAFEANFKPVHIVKVNGNFFVYKEDASDSNDYIYNSNSKDNIDGWLYGAVQAKNKVIAEAFKIKEKYNKISESFKKFKSKKLSEGKSLKEAMSQDELYDAVKEVLDNMSDDELLSVHREYCSNNSYFDDEIYSMDDFDDIIGDMKPWDAIRAAFFGDFRPTDSYWKFNGYANLVSTDYVTDWIDKDDIADYVVRNEDALYNDDIEAVLEQSSEDDEVEESLKKKRVREGKTSRKMLKSLKEGWRGSDIEMIWNGTQSDPELKYRDYIFNYWDIEDALWSDFLEATGHSDSESGDAEVESEFNQYVQENAANYLDDYIEVGNAPKDWKHIGESFEKVELETEDKVIKVSEEPKEEVPDAEMIEPLDIDSKKEIIGIDDETGSGGDEDYVSQDFDEFEEEDFDELGESYLKKVYDNVDSFKTSKVTTKGNTLQLEGVIKFASGSSKNTTFLFEAKDITKRGKVRFVGENLQISRGKKSFTLTGSVKNNKLISESLNYNYRAKDANGKSVRLYGTVKR